MPEITSIDHLVLTVADMDETITFYHDVLGMQARGFAATDGSTRWALYFGAQKINLHQAGAVFLPHAATPQPGSADLCFLSDTPLADWLDHFTAVGIPLIDGPVSRSGATGPIQSLYIRDPDGNLIEVSNPA